MFGNNRFSRWLLAAALLTAAEGVGIAAVTVAFTTPADAQWWNGDTYQRRQRPQRSGGFFQDLFGPRNGPDQRPYGGGYEYERRQGPSTHRGGGGGGGDGEGSSRAPAPRKADKDAPAPTTSIVVMGDAMADWLAHGLEEAFADAPEIGIVRKNKIGSGLLRYDPRNDLDWWHVAKDLLAQEKPNYIVMMLGIGDRQNIRERDLAKEAEKKAKELQDKKDAEKKDGDKKEADKKAADAKPADTKPADQDASKQSEEADGVAPEPARRATGVLEFRTEQWAQVYSRRIDDTIAALKSKGVPVFWVGLPAIRGTKSTSEMVYLNDLYRTRAERAGAIYIDVWDGFVDESGKFTQFGPDYEGQNRRLRTSEGVFFTKYGARKLAHYVEREIRRVMSNRGPIALPAGPMTPLPSDGKPAARPLAGPVVPLTVTPANSDALLGGAGGSGSAHGDALAAQVLVKGETMNAPYGRADDFVWPRSETNRPAPVSTAPATGAAAALPAAAAAASAAVPPAARPEEPAARAAPQPNAKPETRAEQRTEPAGRPAQTARPAPRTAEPPRPPQPVRPQSRGPFDFFR